MSPCLQKSSTFRVAQQSPEANNPLQRRPRSAVGALDAVDKLTVKLQYWRYNFVVEGDINGFFDNIDHLDFRHAQPIYNAVEKTRFRGVTMEGIQFLTNDKGERIAVQIDLRKHADIWEDLYDSLTARERSKEPRESLNSVKERLIKRRKLNG